MAQQYDINEVSDHVAMLQRAGASDDAIIEFLGKAGWSLDQYAAQVNRLNEAGGSFEKSGKAMGVVNAFQQGAALGFADEIQGAGQALYDIATGPAELGDFPGLYRQSRAKADLSQADFARENPNTAALASGTGGALPALLPAGKLTQSGVNVVQRVGNAAFTGGVAGAAGGAGAAQPGERTDAAYRGALEGTAIGAAFGGAVESLGPLKAPVMELADYVSKVVSGRRGGPVAVGGGPTTGAAPSARPAPSPAATGKVLDAIQRDGMDPLAMLGAAQSARAGGTPMQLAELGGPNLQGLGRATVTMPGQGRALAEAGLGPTARPSAQRGRLEGQLEGLAGRPIPSPAELADEMAARKVRRTADYEQAEALGAIDDPTGTQGIPKLVEKLESAPIYAEKWASENASRARVGKSLPPLFDEAGRVVRPPTVEDVNIIKKGLDTEVYGASGILTPESAVAKANVGRVEGARRELLEETDKRAPGYAATRARAGDDFEVANAAELAKDISRLSPQEVRDFLRGASQDAAATFRAQAMLSLREKLMADSDRGAAPALVRDLWGSGDGKMAAVMKEVFGGDSRKFGEFSAAMERELQKVRTRNFMFGGSNTANKLAEVADLQGGGFEEAAVQLAWGGPQAAATGAFARWAGRIAGRNQAGWREGTRDEIAQRLFADPAEATDDFLRALDRVRQEREAAMRAGGASSVASGAAAAQSARPQAGP